MTWYAGFQKVSINFSKICSHSCPKLLLFCYQKRWNKLGHNLSHLQIFNTNALTWPSGNIHLITKLSDHLSSICLRQLWTFLSISARGSLPWMLITFNWCSSFHKTVMLVKDLAIMFINFYYLLLSFFFSGLQSLLQRG